MAAETSRCSRSARRRGPVVTWWSSNETWWRDRARSAGRRCRRRTRGRVQCAWNAVIHGACKTGADFASKGARRLLMSMKHPEKFHGKAASKRRAKQQRLKEERKERRQQLSEARTKQK